MTDFYLLEFFNIFYLCVAYHFKSIKWYKIVTFASRFNKNFAPAQVTCLGRMYNCKKNI